MVASLPWPPPHGALHHSRRAATGADPASAVVDPPREEKVGGGEERGGAPTRQKQRGERGRALGRLGGRRENGEGERVPRAKKYDIWISSRGS